MEDYFLNLSKTYKTFINEPNFSSNMSKRRLRREKARLRELGKGVQPEEKEAVVSEPVHHHKKPSKGGLGGLLGIYESQYKILLLIPLIMLILAILQIGYQMYSTGDFVDKGVSLKGGVTVTLPNNVFDVAFLQKGLSSKFPSRDIEVRSLSQAGKIMGTIVEADITESSEIDNLVQAIKGFDPQITEDDYSVNSVGSSLGRSFFQETLRSLSLAFLFMGLVVFLYFGPDFKTKAIAAVSTFVASGLIFFGKTSVTDIISIVIVAGTLYLYYKTSIPSIAVILAAVSDIIITLAVFNILGMKLSTASIAAFLMLIGYSVDTDILLSTRVLRRKEGTVLDGVYSAIKTGMTMTVTTLVAVLLTLFIAESDVLKQIMIILLIGLLIDIVNTWIQNAGILRWHLEKGEQGVK